MKQKNAWYRWRKIFLQHSAICLYRLGRNHDWTEDIGQTITLCRLSPDCKKIFIGKGTIKGGAYKEIPNCTPTIIFQVKDHKEFHDKQLDFGTHLPLAYGDHSEVLKLFAKSVGLEVVEA